MHTERDMEYSERVYKRQLKDALKYDRNIVGVSFADPDFWNKIEKSL